MYTCTYMCRYMYIHMFQGSFRDLGIAIDATEEAASRHPYTMLYYTKYTIRYYAIL